jgi:hypothetical protein
MCTTTLIRKSSRALAKVRECSREGAMSSEVVRNSRDVNRDERRDDADRGPTG